MSFFLIGKGNSSLYLWPQSPFYIFHATFDCSTPNLKLGEILILSTRSSNVNFGDIIGPLKLYIKYRKCITILGIIQSFIKHDCIILFFYKLIFGSNDRIIWKTNTPVHSREAQIKQDKTCMDNSCLEASIIFKIHL